MAVLNRLKRTHPTARGRGVTAAHRTFTPASGGSNPSGLNQSRVDGREPRARRDSSSRLSSLVSRLNGDRGVSGSTSGSYPVGEGSSPSGPTW